MYKVVLNKAASKRFTKPPRNIRDQIIKAGESLATNPFSGKKLSGELKDSFRIRVGNFRIIYDIYQDQKIVLIHIIGSRGDVYK